MKRLSWSQAITAWLPIGGLLVYLYDLTDWEPWALATASLWCTTLVCHWSLPKREPDEHEEPTACKVCLTTEDIRKDSTLCQKCRSLWYDSGIQTIDGLYEERERRIEAREFPFREGRPVGHVNAPPSKRDLRSLFNLK